MSVSKGKCTCGDGWVGRHKLSCSQGMKQSKPPKAQTSSCSPSKVKRYKGIREPRCNGGDGCWPCWAKFVLNNPKWDPLGLKG